MKTEPERNLTVIIPAFNEEQSIGAVVTDVLDKCRSIVSEIIVVDDGSSDATARLAEERGAKVIRHFKNKGYGAALKTGIRAAQTQFIVTMDSDGQHKAEDVLRLYEEAGANDMVVGRRTGILHSALWRMPGKWLLWIMANYIANYKIPDLNSGLRIISTAVALRYIHLCPSGFSFSTTITMAMLCRGYRVSYVPIQPMKRTGKSTVSVSTGLDTIILILRIAALFNPLRIFIPLSAIVGGLGVLLSVDYYIQAGTIQGAPLILLTSSILFFILGLMCDQISQLRLERFD